MNSTHFHRQNALLVFVKYPTPRQVKTRLGQEIGYENAAGLYHDFVEYLFQRLDNELGIDCLVYYAPAEKEKEFRSWLGDHRYYLSQSDGNLGNRLVHGFEQGFQTYSRIIAIGTDSPDLPIEYLDDAFHHLKENDVVLGPCDDGGYYLIGLSHPFPALFHNIPWSTSRVFETTLQKINRAGAMLEVLPKWYDVDTFDDLQRLAKSKDPTIQSILYPYLREY